MPIWLSKPSGMRGRGCMHYKKFKLTATINHSGIINAGHYCGFIRKINKKSWLNCNDTSASKVLLEDLSNYTSKTFIYGRNGMILPGIYFLVFCEGVWLLEILLLGVTTAHIIPVL